MKFDLKTLKWFLPILSGLLLVFSHPPFSLMVLPFFSLLPLLFFLNVEKVSAGKSFFAGLIAGIIFLGGTLSWFFSTLPLRWLGIENELLGSSLLILTCILLILVLACFVGLFSLSCFFLKKKKLWSVLLIPSIWVIFEYLRAWAFGILYYGEESLFGAHWTFSNLAYTLAQNQGIRFLAGVGGIYLISFLVVFINALIFYLIVKQKKAYIFLIIFIIALISFSYSFSFQQNIRDGGPSIKVAVLQTKIHSVFQDKSRATERFQIQEELVHQAFQSSNELDLMVFPEGSQFLSWGGSKKILDDLSEKSFLVVDSTRIKTAQGTKSRATLYNTKKGNLSEYDKMLLVPIGDYLPYFFKLPAQIINKQWVERLESSKNYQKGEKMTLLSDKRSFHGGVLFCSESISPVLYRETTEKSARVLLNLGSLAFSHGSQMLNAQTQAILQLRAAENNRYLIRATNFGTSYIINNRGQVVEKTEDMENQVLFGEARLFSQETFYTRIGDWVLVLSVFFVLIFLIYRSSLLKLKR